MTQTLAPPPPSSVSTSKSAVLGRSTSLPVPPVSLQYDARSAKTMWLPRVRNVQFEMTRSHCTFVQTRPLRANSMGGNTSGSLSNAATTRVELVWQDVLGAHVLTEDGEHLVHPVDLTTVNNDKTFVLALFAFPVKHAKPDKLKKRDLREWLFRFPGRDMEAALTLVTWINFMADPRSYKFLADAQSLEDITPVELPRRRFLVIINPVGGAGKGVQTFETRVAPIFKFANIDAEVKLTERAHHGTEIAKTLPLDTYDCVIAVGGDGSLAEIFQGLMGRPDWKDAIRQPIGIVPGGSGNGLFASIMHDIGERFRPRNAAFVLAKGVPQPLDITAVRNPHGDCMYSFLSTEWALIADVDVESEKLRALGGARFTVTTLQHIFMRNKVYEGTVWYLEESDSSFTPTSHEPSESLDRIGFDLLPADMQDGVEVSDGSQARWRKVQGSFHLVWTMNVTHAALDAQMAPGAGLNDGFNYLILVDGSRPRKDLLSLFLVLENGGHVERDMVRFIKTRAYKIVPSRDDDLICVDGEVFRGPVEAQVHHSVARILTLPNASL
ncbi:hypothetical protein P43SY_008511 [Pythium insidiosum]|uniref:DAGKc domain-containing protein n=1 Tax=Pythium insidiosum TaxID=114742 RepID=A0AAD5M9L8_PYTIN|nr:hypothetical protein P43SY_008511 [Pythium insidiosum]